VERKGLLLEIEKGSHKMGGRALSGEGRAFLTAEKRERVFRVTGRGGRGQLKKRK